MKNQRCILLGKSQVLLVEHSRCIRRLILHKVHDTPGSQGRMLFLLSKETTLFYLFDKIEYQVRMNIIRLVSALEFDLRIRSQNTMGMTVKVTICEVVEPMSSIRFPLYLTIILIIGYPVLNTILGVLARIIVILMRLLVVGVQILNQFRCPGHI